MHMHRVGMCRLLTSKRPSWRLSGLLWLSQKRRFAVCRRGLQLQTTCRGNYMVGASSWQQEIFTLLLEVIIINLLGISILFGISIVFVFCVALSL